MLGTVKKNLIPFLYKQMENVPRDRFGYKVSTELEETFG